MNSHEHTTVLVTGASGQVGRHLCRILDRAGAQVRAATYQATEVTGGRRVHVDLAEPSTLEPALRGVDAVFLIWPFFHSEADARRLVAPVADLLGTHARRVVYLSSQGVENDRHNFWSVVEDAVSEHLDEWTMLRPTGFAANARQWAPQITSHDLVRWPFGHMARPLIHEADIADVAVKALLDDGHHGRSYVITGPEYLTQQRQVELIGNALGRTISWKELDRGSAQSEFHIPDAMLDAWESFIDTPEPLTNVVEQITGHPALTFSNWARDNVNHFR